LREPRSKSNGDVPQNSSSFYARWRVQSGVVSVLNDDHDSPPEHLVQCIWQHQRLTRDKLVLLDGRPLQILHPGFRSFEGGPDFQRAVVQFGDDLPVSGDVEVDLRASGWKSHGHDRNTAFKKVILHVVWEQPAGNPSMPTLVLRGVLDAPLGELSYCLGAESAELLPEQFRGKCCAPLRDLEGERVLELLRQSAAVRLRIKASQFAARARQSGWTQSLWEGLFRALGYKHNSWAMQRLGELRPRWCAAVGSVPALQARLLGISGLLPAELPAADSSQSYLRTLWDHWWRERDVFSECLLPRSLWRLHGLRPANSPQRRLALAAAWAQTGTTIEQQLLDWCARLSGNGEDGGIRRATRDLLRIFNVPRDPYWSWHLTLTSRKLEKPQPLIGETRITDLAINMVLPWLWARAQEGGNEALRDRVEKCYFDWPAAEDNSTLKLARQRLFRVSPKGLFETAAAQQGLLQITRDFCDNTNAICESCRLPALVKEFAKTETQP
jgi:hypothetical protein